MTNAEGNMLELHEDRDRFGEALSFTEAELRFPARLVEKDYYCTVLLEYLAGKVTGLVFKGGTCLAKVHTHFFRLSEDLGFRHPCGRRHLAHGAPQTCLSFEGFFHRACACLAVLPDQGAVERGKQLDSICWQRELSVRWHRAGRDDQD